MVGDGVQFFNDTLLRGADLGIATSTTEHMAGIDTAPVLRYLGRFRTEKRPSRRQCNLVTKANMDVRPAIWNAGVDPGTLDSGMLQVNQVALG